MPTTLLPMQEIRHLKHEYRLRCLILFFFFLSGAVWVGIIALFPSYIISVTEERSALAQVAKIDSTRQANGATAIDAQIQDANTLVHTVAATQDSLFFSSLIEDIDSHRVPGMIITGFTLSHAPGGAGSLSGNTAATKSIITINGNAATRDILVAFEDNLQNDPRLTQVVLPVSDLAKDSNIDFTITINGVQ